MSWLIASALVQVMKCSNKAESEGQLPLSAQMTRRKVPCCLQILPSSEQTSSPKNRSYFHYLNYHNYSPPHKKRFQETQQ